MSVNLVDPNLLNTNPDFVNGIPQYQDMFIMAELTAKSKGRTVLETNNSGKYSLSKTASQDEISVNFIGNNQNQSTTNPNYLKFTTNWYDGSAVEGFQYEGFGMSSIKVTINSSFVPQVNIQFIDVRGLAFFNQADSPYRVLFNFPPPMFFLTIKGYYGMPLTYELHLVKYTSEFKAENGNFIIDAQFVARTFAPLTDVLFRYIINFPLLPNQNNKSLSLNPTPDQPPNNTYELILKLKNLYAATSDKQNSGINTQAIDIASNKISAINTIFNSINAFAQSPYLVKYTPIAMIGRLNSPNFIETYEVTTISENVTANYNKIIEGFNTSGYPEKIPEKLLVGYFITKENIPINVENPLISGMASKVNPIENQIASLNEYRQNLIDQANPKQNAGSIKGNILESDIIKADTLNTTSGTYVVIDVTNYYVKLFQLRNSETELMVAEQTRINLIINNMILQTLGMTPTIYNIFKIILNDVDVFFRVLRDTAIAAEKHHNTNEVLSKLINSELYQDTEKKVFAFPLIIKKTTQPPCNVVSETRTAPRELSTPDSPFPEMSLVKDFIDTFILQRNITEQIDMRNTVSADGKNVWIPLSPFDSNLGTNVGYTPYINVDSNSSQQQIPLSQYSKLVQPLIIMLKRFYILSQNAFPYKFYEEGNTEYIKLFAESEAINMALSVFNTAYIELLLNFAKNNKNPQTFYDNVTTLMPMLEKFKENEYEFFSLTDGSALPTGRTEYFAGDAYTNKYSEFFHGFIFSDKDIIFRPPIVEGKKALKEAEKNNDPIETFLISSSLSWWKKTFGRISLESTLNFSTENVIFIPDTPADGEINKRTRFLTDRRSVKCSGEDGEKIEFITTSGNISEKRKTRVINGMNDNNSGNNYFNINSIVGKESPFTNIIDVWSETLGYNDEKIFDTIIDVTNKGGKNLFNPQLSKIVLASSFGYALSTFNIFPSDLNKSVFGLPAAVTIPSFIYSYMGSLVGIEENSEIYDDLYDFFVSGPGKNLESGGVLIFADIVDTNNQLANADKSLFKKWYEDFYINDRTYDELVSNLSNLYSDVQKDLKELKKTAPVDVYNLAKVDKYKTYLTNSAYGDTIIEPLMERTCIANYSEMTFKRDVVAVPLYKSLSETKVGKTSTFNDSYFSQFFMFLQDRLEKRIKEKLDQKIEDDKLIGDEDIINQTYYSFKNINDKWLSSPKFIDANYAYPSNGPKAEPLLNSFAFVDRAMNPVGNTIINPEILIQLFDDPNVSVFSVLSQLLSMNGFEFFPLQNFMSYTTDDWVNSFLIDVRGDVRPRPAFVCMYIGGSSRYPTTIETFGGQYKDDGISDIRTIKQFNTNDCDDAESGSNSSDDNQEATNPEFPYRDVRAFKVGFGKQNQSMFTDIKIDSKEYPETNESIQILSRIAGDNKAQAPPPKGQNLYNLYENRSYRATITGLGNAMIQPTQYFQLENVPMFNGAYIILSVEHNIEPNKMTTNFSGTKILKYPIPRVLEPSVVFGFSGGNTPETNASQLSDTTATEGPNASAGKSQAQYNSMYEFKIK